MEDYERRVIIRVIEWCIKRIRNEETDYETAADNVVDRLYLLSEWLRTTATREERANAERQMQE